jgi:hypothetical protein
MPTVLRLYVGPLKLKLSFLFCVMKHLLLQILPLNKWPPQICILIMQYNVISALNSRNSTDSYCFLVDFNFWSCPEQDVCVFMC